MKTRTMTLMLCLLVPAVPAAAQPQPELTARGQRITAGLLAHDSQILPVHTIEELPAALTLPVTLGGEQIELMAVRHSLRAPNFQMVAHRGGEDYEVIDPGPVRTYRGVIAEEPGTEVRLTLKSGGINARVNRGGSVWYIQPIGPVEQGSALHAVYRQEDTAPTDARCGVDENDFNAPDRHALEAQPGSAGAGGDDASLGGGVKAEIAFDADFEFYQEWFSDVYEVHEEIVNILNNVEAIYEDQVNISYRMTRLIIRTSSNDPYTSNTAGTRLQQFKDHWQTAQAGVPRDVAHLMTGVDLVDNENDSSLVGLAYTGGIGCASNSLHYGLSEEYDIDSLQAELVSHELGHNWNACHCNDTECNPDWDGGPLDRCGIMTDFLSTFSGDDFFVQFSKNQINGHRDLVDGCILDSCGGCCGNPTYVFSSADFNNAMSSAPCGSEIYPAHGPYFGVNLLTRPPGAGPVTIIPVFDSVIIDPQ